MSETFVVVLTGEYTWHQVGGPRDGAQHPTMLRMAAPEGMTQARCQLCRGTTLLYEVLAFCVDSRPLCILCVVLSLVLTQATANRPHAFGPHRLSSLSHLSRVS